MKQMTMKRVLSVVLALVMVMSALCFSGCFFSRGGERDDFIKDIGGVSETYQGGLSEKSYATADAAAKDYVAVEVVGNSKAEIVSTESKGELSDKEIKAAGIPDEFLKDADAVEEIEVTYTVSEGTSLNAGVTKLATETLNKTKKVKVYVIKCGVDWKYFTPRPVTGETIQKSYYDSVFDTEKYKNCTFETDMEIYMKVSGNVEGQSIDEEMTMGMKQIIKYADDKVYLEMTTTSDMTGVDLNTKICAYMEVVNGKMVCYVKMDDDDEWVEGDLTTVGFSDLEELTPFYDQYLDYTYFTKTDYGFVLNNDNAAAYIQQAFDDLAGDMLSMLGDGMDIDMYAEYYVNEGVLSGMRVDADIALTYSVMGQSMDIKETVKGISTCTDYGKTVVEKPFVD